MATVNPTNVDALMQPQGVNPVATEANTQAGPLADRPQAISSQGASPKIHDFASDIIELDVGGKRFKTTRGTLTSRPGFLADLVAPKDPKAAPQKDAIHYFFIDRDGEDFGHILNYLRTSAFNPAATPKLNKALGPKVVSALRIEAGFYRLADLVTELKYIYPARVAKNQAKQSGDEPLILAKHLDYYMTIFLYQDEEKGTKKLMKIYQSDPSEMYQLFHMYKQNKRFPLENKKTEYYVHESMFNNRRIGYFEAEEIRKLILAQFSEGIMARLDKREWPQRLLKSIDECNGRKGTGWGGR